MQYCPVFLYQLYAFPFEGSVYRETVHVLHGLLGKTHRDIYAYPDTALLTQLEWKIVQVFWYLRLLGYPMAYIMLEATFWSHTFRVCPACLIPRPETEHLVEIVLETLPEDKVQSVVELGVGSGAVLLSLAMARPQWHMTATDISEKALCIAKYNAGIHKIHEKVVWHCGDWLSGLGQFDAIVSNPPYVAPSLEYRFSPLCFEPSQALFSDEGGLRDLHAVIAASFQHIKPGGWIFLEHGAFQGKAVQQCLLNSGFDTVKTAQDLSGRDRMTRGRKKRH